MRILRGVEDEEEGLGVLLAFEFELEALRLAGGAASCGVEEREEEGAEGVGEVAVGEVAEGTLACSLVCFTFWKSLCRSGPDWDVYVEA